MLKHLIINSERQLTDIDTNIFDVVIVGLPIYTQDVTFPYNDKYSNSHTKEILAKIILKSKEILKNKGVILIYGSPIQLIEISKVVPEDLKFKHWIALDLLDSIQKEDVNKLKHNHIGILMLIKGNGLVHLDTKNTRVPYFMCPACGNNSKDWGGKKHLMNINGAGISDVWKDFYRVIDSKYDPLNELIKLNVVDTNKASFEFSVDKIPQPVLERMLRLTNKKENKILYLQVKKSLIKPLNNNVQNNNHFNDILIKNPANIKNTVILGDCIKIMKDLVKKFPNGVFDLVFADPPYNLNKSYKIYDDTLARQEYVDWCNKWLKLCVRLTKPTGSIFILNIPKWALTHAAYLNKIAYLQNWIVWDALSTPKGKIMPAHYTLLYYTKSPIGFSFNKIEPINSPEYCLRSSCINSRNKNINNFSILDNQKNYNKFPLSDIWCDVSRIKHKKNRDDHPCQLPDKLMNRLIKIFSNENDLIFDPFAGAGTTAISAIKNKRNYCTIEIDPFYKEITEKKLSQVIKNGDVIHKSTKKTFRSVYTKRDLEIKAQKLTKELGKKPSLQNYLEYYSLNILEINKLYSDPNQVLKAGRVTLINQGL